MRQSFEAGGTRLWGAEYDFDSDSEMTSLAPIKETDSNQENASDQESCGDVTSYTDTITESANHPMRRRQSDLRSNLLRHKQLWQKAAQQAKQGGNTENRRRSILEDIGLTDFRYKASINSSIDDEDEEEPSEALSEETERFPQDTQATNNQPRGPPAPHNHTKVLPISSSDIESNVKPQLRADRNIWGFLFPRMPTQFTTELNESLFQRYYSHKRKKTMLMVNILYSCLLIALFIPKILPMPTHNYPVDVPYMVRETLITSIMLGLHVVACVLIKRANSCTEVVRCAYATWVLLELHTQFTPISSFLNYRSMNDARVTWDSYGTWQTALAISAPFGFLSVIPLRKMLLLSMVMAVLHLVSAGILTGIHDTSCLHRVSTSLITIKLD